MWVLFISVIPFFIYENECVDTSTEHMTTKPPPVPVVGGFPSDKFEESFNFLDGDSFGIGPMHEFVYGWQSIVSSMSMKNNIESRKRAGMQRFALAGINGISLISHIGITTIMINGTRTFCFGEVVRPPGHRNLFCKGDMYQEERFDCKTPYLRYPTDAGYYYCIDEFAVVKEFNTSDRNGYCVRGESVPKYVYDYICERRHVQIRHINITDPIQRRNIRNPIVRRVEYYRAPNDILKLCPDWYGCDVDIAPEFISNHVNKELLKCNDTYVATGGRYWKTLYYSKLASWAEYFQARWEYPWDPQRRPLLPFSKDFIWQQIMRMNIGRDMHIHYNLNGIFNKYPKENLLPDLMRNEEQIQPGNMQSDVNIGEQGEEDCDEVPAAIPNYPFKMHLDKGKK